jgi:hypothetical protein
VAKESQAFHSGDDPIIIIVNKRGIVYLFALPLRDSRGCDLRVLVFFGVDDTVQPARRSVIGILGTHAGFSNSKRFK